jgi:copper transporter 1
MFAGSCIGVIFLVIVLEFLRRLGREYDTFIVRRARLRGNHMTPPSPRSHSTSPLPLQTDVEPQADRDTATVEAPGHCCNANASTSRRASDDLNTPPNGPKNEATVSAAQTGCDSKCERQRCGAVLPPYRPSLMEHTFRSLLHMLQFAVAYIIMLLAMYFNGYIIICIFIGVFLGAFVFSWEPMTLHKE